VASKAKVDRRGTKRWYQNGLLHRLDGPAVEYANGSKAWCQNGEPHRLDGPAVEWADGEKYWYIEGKEYTEEQFNKIVNPRPLEGKQVVIEGKEYILS
jgi:hypothetical protein